MYPPTGLELASLSCVLTTQPHTHTHTKLIEWFEEYAEEFFQTHTELGESLDVAETLVAELKQFEDSTKVKIE